MVIAGPERDRRDGGPRALLVLAPLVAAWLLAVPATLTVGAAAADECAAADVLLDGGGLAQVQQADAAYRQVLAATPGSACAATGHAVATHLVAAVDLHRAGLDPAASAELVEAIRLRPQTAMPAELTGTPQGAGRPGPQRGFQTAAALERAGFHDTAVQVLQQTLTSFPDAAPTADLEPILRDVRPAHRSPWQSDTWLTMVDWATLALAPALVVLLIGLALYRRRRGARLLIGTTSGEASAPIASPSGATR